MIRAARHGPTRQKCLEAAMAAERLGNGAWRVLVVEDEPAVRALLSMALEAESYQVETAEDGEEALAKVQLQQPDLILLDMALPRMDGPAVIEALRADPNTRDVKIVSMSAVYGLLSAMKHPVQGYVPKPFDTDVLLNILEEVLRQEPFSVVV
jgi:CheY-like chemotaxis protein